MPSCAAFAKQLITCLVRVAGQHSSRSCTKLDGHLQPQQQENAFDPVKRAAVCILEYGIAGVSCWPTLNISKCVQTWVCLAVVVSPYGPGTHPLELSVLRIDGGTPPRYGDAKLLQNPLRCQACCRQPSVQSVLSGCSSSAPESLQQDALAGACQGAFQAHIIAP